MRRVLPFQPPDFVDLLFDLQTFEIVELGFVALKRTVDVVFSSARVGFFRLQIHEIKHFLLLCSCVSFFFLLSGRFRSTLTAGSRWKMTTRPPLSPVANKSPSWLNSTQDIMSAGDIKKNWRELKNHRSSDYGWPKKGSMSTTLASVSFNIVLWPSKAVLPSVTSSSRVPLT